MDLKSNEGENVMSMLGETVKRIRKSRNMSQKTFAKSLGYKSAMYPFIESRRLFHDYNNTKTLLLATERRPSLPFALRGRQSLSPALHRLA